LRKDKINSLIGIGNGFQDVQVIRDDGLVGKMITITTDEIVL
jgi:hypothetical protein